MIKPELFMLLAGLKKHIERKQWDDVEEIVTDTLWAVADEDWKDRQKAKQGIN
ncbi:MAG: hypothetical protein FWG45_07245 [Oscillospiraceae bacterium]|nr:hypothetical protein [Oscillospiraceae bacterium]